MLVNLMIAKNRTIKTESIDLNLVSTHLTKWFTRNLW